MTDQETRRTYTAFVQLGFYNNTNSSWSPAQKAIGPGRDTRWEVLRVWAFSTGYELQPIDFSSLDGADYDPYYATRGNFAGVTDSYPLNYTPYAAIYRQRVAQDAIIQEWNYVPRGYTPVDLNQPTLIGANEQIVFMAAENVPFSGDFGFRKTRGINYGIEVSEIETASA